MRQLGIKKRKSAPFVKIIVFTVILSVLTIAVIRLFNLEKLVFRGPKTVVDLITDSGLKTDRGRVNVLLLGTGGAGHDGPDLSDTIILASIERDSGHVVLVSIPRDLWVPSLSAKINSAYAYGQEKDEGLELAKNTIREIFDLPVHYAVRLDFNGFIKAVDLVGGLDIEIDTAFQDYKYPIAGRENDLCQLTIEKEEIDGILQEVVKDATGSSLLLNEINDENNPFVCRYETISFEKGQRKMNGETALKFVRSRHGTNDQGSDFARSARQQKVILAFQKKVLSTKTLLNPKTIIELVATFGRSVDTDIDNDKIPLFVKLIPKIDTLTIRRLVLDTDQQSSLLTNGDPENYGGQYVLIPKGGSYIDLAEYIQGEIFKLEEKKNY